MLPASGSPSARRPIAHKIVSRRPVTQRQRGRCRPTRFAIESRLQAGISDRGSRNLAEQSAVPTRRRWRSCWRRPDPNRPPVGPVAPAGPNPAPLPGGTLCRSHLRQEPSAGIPHAGICAGGRPQGRSLPQPEPSTAPSCASSHGVSTSTWLVGPCTSLSGSARDTCGRWNGYSGSTAATPNCSPTGSSLLSPMAGLWGPDDGRPSRRS